MRLLHPPVLLLFTAPLLATDPAPDIMRRVAENQDRAYRLREDFIYQQRVTIATRRANGRLIRQETAEYLITPTPAGIEKKLLKLDGRYWEKGRYIDFHGEPAPQRDSMDGDMINDFREDLLDGKSKDGIAPDLFPLTAEEQKAQRFEFAGEQMVDGRKAYRIRFGPADKHELAWAGEALIDAGEFQPVSVYTRLSRRIPVAIRTLLGTDLPGVGFNVRYQRMDQDIWFPVRFGTEFRIHVLFFLNRIITIASESSGFRRANVESNIRFDSPK